MSIGIWQLILIFLIILVIFGAGKLPKVMSDVGKGVKSLKKGLNEDDSTEAAEPAKDIKKATPAKKTTAKKPAAKKPAAKKTTVKKPAAKKTAAKKPKSTTTKAPKKS